MRDPAGRRAADDRCPAARRDARCACIPCSDATAATACRSRSGQRMAASDGRRAPVGRTFFRHDGRRARPTVGHGAVSGVHRQQQLRYRQPVRPLPPPARRAAPVHPAAAFDGVFPQRLGWGDNVSHYSHACVSANLGLLYASRQVAAGLADEALVVSYDFLSPFVTGGFHAMKILIGGEMPAPYADRPFGAIGLGDGAAFAVIAPAGAGGRRGLRLEGQAGCNEMYHFTGNHPDGVGMGELGARMQAAWATGRCGSRATAPAPSRPGGWRRGTWRNVSPTRRWSAGRVRSGTRWAVAGWWNWPWPSRACGAVARRGRSARAGRAFGPQVATEAFDLSGFGGRGAQRLCLRRRALRVSALP